MSDPDFLKNAREEEKRLEQRLKAVRELITAYEGDERGSRRPPQDYDSYPYQPRRPMPPPRAPMPPRPEPRLATPPASVENDDQPPARKTRTEEIEGAVETFLRETNERATSGKLAPVL